MVVCYSPYAVRFLRDKFLAKADPNYRGPKRFFVTRRNFSRNPDNNADVESFFADLGWQIMDLAKLTFAQEIRLFSEAEAVAGVTGSGLTNMVFGRADCAVIAIGHDYWTDGTLDWLLQVVGTKRYSFKVYPSDGRRRFRVDMADLKQQVRSAGFVS
jgi:capsular polysaccharide biosynthesis protein